MEQKSRLWRKKQSDSDSLIAQEEKEKVIMLEKSLQDLKEQLSLVHTESDAKGELLAKQGKVAQEALAGWKKAESELSTLKQKVAKTEEEKARLNADNTNKLSLEQEKLKILEEKLTEANDRISILTIENTNLYSIIDTKETIIKEFNESKDRVTLVEVRARLDSTEKENVSLKYELCMVQKELEIRNKERDYNIKTAEAAYKQQMESLKKIAKLESECNKLRVMVRKRLPGPGAIAKMRNEVENVGNFAISTNNNGRKKSNNSIVERLHVVEEENRVLKESLNRKNNEDTMSCITESWAKSVIGMPDFRLIDDFIEAEKFGTEKSAKEENQFDGFPNWVKDIVRVIIEKHYFTQKSVQYIIEEVIIALKKSGFYNNNNKEEKDLKNTSFNERETEKIEENGDCVNGEIESKWKVDGGEKEDAKEMEGIIGDELVQIGKEKVNGICDKLEGKMSVELELQPQLESTAIKASPVTSEQDTEKEETQLRTESEITSAAQKLAECQETITNLSKQLESMSNQKDETPPLNKIITTSPFDTTKSNQRSNSLYQMLANEDTKLENANGSPKSNENLPKYPENTNNSAVNTPSLDGEKIEGLTVIVPKRQKVGVGLLRRILFRRKKKEKKLTLAISS